MDPMVGRGVEDILDRPGQSPDSLSVDPVLVDQIERVGERELRA